MLTDNLAKADPLNTSTNRRIVCNPHTYNNKAEATSEVVI